MRRGVGNDRQALDFDFGSVFHQGADRHHAHGWIVAAQHFAVSRADLPLLRVYCSEQAHSSIEKAVLTLGLGQRGLRKIECDDRFRMRADKLREAIEEDKANGFVPIVVVATVGTTSTTSIDPVHEHSALFFLSFFVVIYYISEPGFHDCGIPQPHIVVLIWSICEGGELTVYIHSAHFRGTFMMISI